MTEDAWRQQPALARTVPGILSPAECEAVRQTALAAGLSRSLSGTSKGARQSRQRTSDQAPLRRAPDTEWLFERILDVGRKVNAEHWRFTLTGIEHMQVLRYRPMQRFKWHYDVFPGSGRKITCVVSLAAPGSCWRGKLELIGSHKDRALAPLQGSATCFPSYLVHRATAPWWGERWSLVAWLTGPDLV